MKTQRHKRKESFSVILVSNTGQRNRQFQVSQAVFCIFLVLLLLFCVVAGWMSYWFMAGYRKQTELRTRLSSQEQLVRELETENKTLNAEKLALAAEKETLNNEKQLLESELETLQADFAAKTKEAESAVAEIAAIQSADADSKFPPPRRYPYSGTSALISQYSQEQQYISLGTRITGNVIAAGDGVIISIGSDDTYPIIIEVEHIGNYKTRYMCRGQAALQQLEVGDQVQTNDILFTITEDNTQFDYQIFYKNELIDPLTVIDAKG